MDWDLLYGFFDSLLNCWKTCQKRAYARFFLKFLSIFFQKVVGGGVKPHGLILKIDFRAPEVHQKHIEKI